MKKAFITGVTGQDGSYLVEFLLNVTFDITFLGWSIYPLIVLSLIGGLLIYLGINTSLRRVFERKLFF